ncbi:MAG: hypothetical protein Q9190_007223 [Brigantiaea leucoxantha]
MASFNGKVIAITGSASGIGLATALLLASRGASLSLADVRPEPLSSAISTILKSTPSAHIISRAIDVTSSSDVESWLDATIAEFGHLDGAANLAGIEGGDTGVRGVVDTDEAEFDKVISVNLKGVFNCLKGELKRMIVDGADDAKEKGRGGSIVNASSVAGLTGGAKTVAYTASKHAVIGMTKTAAKEVGKQGVRVNAIAPGVIVTPMLDRLSVQYGIEAGGRFGLVCALGRSGEAEEVARLIAFLLSAESAYCTGGVYCVDGGYL